MTESELYKLKFPISEFTKPESITINHIKSWIADIEALPKTIINLTKNLSEKELNYKYRPNGWTIKQVVHHCADSHINSLLRFKITLTEKTPTIRPYFEDRFAELVDYTEPIEDSILILKGVHKKLGVLLKSLSQSDLKLEFIHPEHGKRFSLEETIGIYAWHSNHHIAHIIQALEHKDLY
ncbi:YfiT family bacillithiol transferase [Winogradskyella endarachnes]|uniref:Putative metal-dependent hydrolase n=1 Tax=Winogradskyella endarachnes TaxID=2681965 RepID=A0A6L6UF68_9FLAO|nr:putative metal-dependent hydrolase [Winogradskyella endarachnes]MUU79484.1 putative metal-dependent hydrolase [Winogradskyella endarachnes]